MGAISTSMDERARSLVAASSPPPSFEAYREFVIGLDRLRENRFPAAWQNFQRAAELDTAFVLASLWGVFALQNEAQFARAESLVNALVPRRASLPAAEQHGLDMFIAEQRNDFEAAYHAARRAADLAPQSNWRYMAGYNAYRIGRPREALHELLDLEPTAGWTTQWTSYWGVRARALHQLEEYEAELKLSNEAMQHVVRASLPPMGILYGSLRSMAALGRLEALDSTFDAALPEMRGARGNLARQLAMLVGNELRAHGHATAAARYYERCLSFGYNAACHYALGHFDQVIDQFSRDSSGADAAALVLARRNSPVEAQRVFDVAAARTSAIGTWSYALAFQKARLAMLMGDRAGAEAIIKAEPQRGRIWELLHESEGGDFKHNDPLLRMLVQTSRRASP
jgi:tetratricopeptide (TPR) repeat protein